MRLAKILLALLVLAIPASLTAQFRVAIQIGPPVIPVYEQPVCPGDGFLWVPGYWAYDDTVADYYWVPGTWVEAPEVGYLWTPGYWGWRDNGYFFNEGYWGPHVGFYGGINYGFGYFGDGFEGGRWDGGHFFYNRAVLNVNVTVIRNVYETKVVVRNDSHVSFNGGRGGLEARATREQEDAAKERHIPPVASQTAHINAARSNPELRSKSNHGDPPGKATAKPGEFNGHAVEAPRAGEPARNEGGAGEPARAIHPSEIQKPTHEPVNSGNSRVDQKYQQKQEKLDAKQDQERQKLQQKQDAEHQKQLNDNQKQQLEQKHQQQTQQLVQRHTAQQQSLQSRQPKSAPPRPK
jgi:hypothetical protein